MNLETKIIITKGFVVAGTAFSSALAGSLAQWSNDGSDPSKIQWVIILATALGAGGSALGGFLSSSFGKYVQFRNGVDNGSKVPEPNKP